MNSLQRIKSRITLKEKITISKEVARSLDKEIEDKQQRAKQIKENYMKGLVSWDKTK